MIYLKTLLVKPVSMILVALLTITCLSSKKVVLTKKESQEKTNTLIDTLKTKKPLFSETTEKPEIEVKLLPAPPKPPKQDSNYKKTMHNRWNTILKDYVSEDGSVDYKGIKTNRNEIDFDIYIDYLTHNLPDDTWTRNEKIAYWINAYNALTIDLILRNYPLKSIKDIKDPWDQRLWQFGDKWLNLNDIEHKILRKMNEPRIHFAIVCASESCPKLQNEAYTASNLDEQLTRATKEFLSDTTKNEISENELKLSKIFRWFKKDFEQDGSLIDFLNRYSDITISEKAKKSYKNYSWDLND